MKEHASHNPDTLKRRFDSERVARVLAWLGLIFLAAGVVFFIRYLAR